MVVSRFIKIQLAIFAVIALVAAIILMVGYVKLPAMFGIGRYAVTIQLQRSGGLYPKANVTYRGTQVGKVDTIGLNRDGHVEAVLSIDSRVRIPSNLRAEIHSQTAIGEQYVALLPRDAHSAPLAAGSVIPLTATSEPPDVDRIFDSLNRGLQAIPHDSLKTSVDESYKAIGGLGPDLSRLVRGLTALSSQARGHLDALTTVIDESAPVLDTQTETAGSVRAWASHLATITGELRAHDTALAGLIVNGGPATDEARQLVDRLQPSLPVLLANLVSVGKVAVTYNNDLEQLLVMIPQGIANVSATSVANLTNPRPHPGSFLDFNLNLNLPPPCTTGYLPAQQRRPPAFVDYPDRPEGDLYCRVPQDSPFNVRGARNIPCETRPGKRAPTVKMCESDEQYVPLNNGYNWKGDPNATWTGQDIPQLPPGALPTEHPAPPPPAVTPYDPATGSYIGPDGHQYTQSDLADKTPKDKTWQAMLTPQAQK